MRRPPLGPAWCTLAVLATASFATILLGNVRNGGYLLAATVGFGALLRLVLPEDSVGGIALRRRSTDVLLYCALAASVATVFAIVRL